MDPVQNLDGISRYTTLLIEAVTDLDPSLYINIERRAEPRVESLHQIQKRIVFV